MNNSKKFKELLKDSFKKITNWVKNNFKKTLEPKKPKDVTTTKRSIESQKPIQIAVEESKYYSQPRTMPEYRPMRQDLPPVYEEDRIVLQVRDPWWIHAYWEIRPQTKDKLRDSLRDEYHQASWCLRIYDVSFIVVNGDNAHSYFDIQLNTEANNWYISVSPGRSYCVDLGLKLRDGRFIMIVRSNSVTTPLDGPSWITDEEWLIPDDLFNKLYGLSFGSSPRKGIRQIIKERFISSPGWASMASPVKVKQLERQFWLAVNTELIVYGATDPDAKVTVQGRNIKLNRDGTFSLRFALPDGKQVIPIRAESKDGIGVRVATPIVTKESK